MKTLSKWNPFRTEESDWPYPSRWHPSTELERMQRRLDSLFGLAPLRGDGGREEAIATSDWSPLVDIAEDDKEYLVKAELPELKKEEVKVHVEGGMLILSGERKFEKEEKDKKYHRVERAYGRFTRSFSLPEDAEAAKISAEFKDGVLKVHLPKNPKASPKAIDIKVN